MSVLDLDFIRQSAGFLALLLFCSYGLSLLRSRFWLIALFQQFKIQYFAGGMILGAVMLFLEEPFAALVMFAIAGAAYYEIRRKMHRPRRYAPPSLNNDAPVFTLMQYNKYHKNRPYVRLKESLHRGEVGNVDFLLIIEVEEQDKEPLDEALRDLYPYGAPEGADLPDMVMLFSKYPLENLEILDLCPDVHERQGFRFDIKPAGFERPIAVYSAHVDSPISARALVEHRAGLVGLARHAGAEPHKDVIVMGDWNTTPYTQVYRSVLALSGAKYQNYRVLPLGTWPSFLMLPFLKIPLDHVLFKGDLVLLDLKKGPCFGSDHHSLLAKFSLK